MQQQPTPLPPRTPGTAREKGVRLFQALSTVMRVYVTLCRCLPRSMIYAERTASCCSENKSTSSSGRYVRWQHGRRVHRKQFVQEVLRRSSSPSSAAHHLAVAPSAAPTSMCAVCMCTVRDPRTTTRPRASNARRTLRCGHSFHHRCIAQWLMCSTCMSCPICRTAYLSSNGVVIPDATCPMTQ